LLVAEHEGFFAEEYVSIEPTYGFGQVPLLAGGQLDLVLTGADAGLAAALTGLEPLYVATVVMKATIGILGGEGVNEAKDLEGKTFGITRPGSNDHFLSMRFLEDKGVDTDKVEFVGVQDEGAALVQLESGQLGGGKFTMESILKAGDGSFTVIATPDDLGTFPWNIVQTTRAFADENGEALTGFLRAVGRGVEFIKDTANESKVIDDVLASNPEGERELVEAAYRAALEYEVYDFGAVAEASLRPALGTVALTGQDGSGLDFSAFVDNSFLEAAG
jgi:ABC-type nitrate/sulfonate/bicarbonate transport system substrate-binding protein